MRYHVKGGIWKNTEDEILKAAVMKYGLNQWSRISSLLVRKSAKQCKERWYEWLDPQIKKTEWTKDEEEKLLHLAKMFPCQWRTIAPIVGRTAYQCMEHYERLLDRAQGREADDNDPRKLRPGEIDPNPETKPARPDPIDMEEDEKETINEARARLANTRGKKAKRKAREKQLEEARRLAALQKKRELKSAGIEVVLRLPRKKKKEMNYNIDVPFLRKVPEGSFQSSIEEVPTVNKFKGAISLQFLENRNRDEEEEKFKKIDEKRMKNLKQKNLPEAIEKINKMNDPLNIIHRNKLVLPDPQITDHQLEGISKLTTGGMLPPNSVMRNNPDYHATRVLMGEYTNARMTPVTVGRTPKVDDHIMKEAKLAISLREGQTPLIGGENSNADLENYKEYRKTESVININATSAFKTPAPLNSVDTKLTKGVDLGKTPLRDELNINMEDSAWENSSSVSVKNSSVKLLLSNLPKPQNKYEIDYTDNSEELKKEIAQKDEMIVEDSEDKNNRLQAEREEEERLDFLNQTKAVQRNLPRPYDINLNYKSYSEIKLNFEDEMPEEEKNYKMLAEDLVKSEMIKLVQYDSINHPVKGNKISTNLEDVDLELVPLEDKKAAEEIVQKELERLKTAGIYCERDMDDYSTLREKVGQEVFYIPDVQMYFHQDDIELPKKFDSVKEIFDIQSGIVNKEANMSKKMEEKANMLTNGYVKKLSSFYEKYEALNKTIEDLKTKKKVYTYLKAAEDFAIVNRKKYLDESICLFSQKERDLQEKYKRYKEKLEELENL